MTMTIWSDYFLMTALSVAPLTQRPVDLLFFVDGSERMGSENFVRVMHFIEQLSHAIPLSKREGDYKGARFAVMQFGGEQDPDLLMDFTAKRRSFANLASRAVYRDSSSTLGSAILFAVNNLVNPGGRYRGVRPDAELAFVFITDGVTSDKDFVEGLQAMRKSNAVSFVITAGSDVNHDRLIQLVFKDKALVLHLNSYKDLAQSRVVKHIAHCLG